MVLGERPLPDEALEAAARLLLLVPAAAAEPAEGPASAAAAASTGGGCEGTPLDDEVDDAPSPRLAPLPLRADPLSISGPSSPAAPPLLTPLIPFSQNGCLKIECIRIPAPHFDFTLPRRNAEREKSRNKGIESAPQLVPLNDNLVEFNNAVSFSSRISLRPILFFSSLSPFFPPPWGRDSGLWTR